LLRAGTVPNGFECLSVPGFVTAGYFGPASNVSQRTFDSCFSTSESAKALIEAPVPAGGMKFTHIYKDKIGGSLALNLKKFAKWLPDASINAQIADDEYNVIVELKDRKFRNVSSVGARIKARISNGGTTPDEKQSLEGCRNMLCSASTGENEMRYAARVLFATPTVTVKTKTAQNISLAAGWNDLGLNVDRSKLNQGELTITWDAELAIAALVKPSRPMMISEAACPQELTSRQREKFESLVTDVGHGLISNYSCQWLSAGVEIANSICGTQPCPPERLLLNIYPKQIKSYSPVGLKSVCEGLFNSLIGIAGAKRESIATEACNNLDDKTLLGGWFYLHREAALCSKTNFVTSKCSQGIIADSPASHQKQIALIGHLFDRYIPADLAISAMAQWDTWGQSSKLSTARAKWDALASDCATTGGCLLPLTVTEQQAVRRISTADHWPTVLKSLFMRWVSFHSDPSHNDFVLGCPAYSMCYIKSDEGADSAEWKLINGSGGGVCLRFGDQPEVKQLPIEFARFVRDPR
jgi:hypothetical protein